jgi:hypothetical protein
MGRAKASGRGPSWSTGAGLRPDTDAPMAIDQAMAGASRRDASLALGHDPMQAMTAWAPSDDREIFPLDDMAPSPGARLYRLTGAGG